MPPMIGGIFYEHGHRMVATTVGFLTICLALLFSRTEERRWVRRAAWGALGLVILQGVLGGLTVLLRLPKPISIVHACTAQTFLSLVTALAVWSSRFWKQTTTQRVDAPGRLPLHHITTGLFIALYVQLILGAVVRHTGHLFVFHVSGALIAFTLGAMAFTRTRRDKTSSAETIGPSRFFAALIFAALIIQIGLGLASYFLLAHNFMVIPVPLYVPISISLHVLTGAALLSASAALALTTYKTRPLDTPPIKTRLADYFQLTKPGISIMAGVTALAGFVLGSPGHVDVLKLINTIIGTLLMAGGAGTCNMLMERDIDARMKRTRSRPLPAGRLLPGEVFFFGTLLSLVSAAYLAWAVNLLTAVMAALAFSVYLYIYTPLKKISAFCTLAGAVAGALPMVIGWTAATNRFDAPAVALFGILFFWQFPHFFSLAWLYKDDYAEGGLHMLPRPSDQGATAAISMVLNSVALLAVSALPTVMGLTGWVYLTAAMIAGLSLLIPSVRFWFDRTRTTARQIFFASLLYVPVLVIFMVLNVRHTR
jgi:protoheme IX farnesyltransferase